MDIEYRSKLAQTIYRERFAESELDFKRAMWKVLCEDYFQQYVGRDDTVLDLGAGTCEFINAINCAHKIAVDLNPDTLRHAKKAKVFELPATDLAPIGTGSVDVVFTSNLFEHLASKEEVLRSLRECYRVLRTGGHVLVLMPNIRYLAGRYWDYFDHHTPLTHLSLAEAMTLAGLEVEKVIPRFLPYTVKTAPVLQKVGLVRAYLRAPVLWRVLGRQMLVVGQRPATGSGCEI